MREVRIRFVETTNVHRGEYKKNPILLSSVESLVKESEWVDCSLVFSLPRKSG